jgi:hypothetical protein
MIETEDAFWLVWSPTGTTPPTHRHEHYHLAQTEAERLARLYPGEEFYVLIAQTKRVVCDMKRIDLVAPIPF